jgi:hypothetical protein
MALPLRDSSAFGADVVPFRRRAGRPHAIYAVVDAAVNRLLDVTLWCERAEKLDAEARAADAIHDLNLHLALRKLRLAAEMAGDPETKRMLGAAAGNILVAQEHDAREDAFTGAIATIVARIAKRVRGLCLSLDRRLAPAAGRRAGGAMR